MIGDGVRELVSLPSIAPSSCRPLVGVVDPRTKRDEQSRVLPTCSQAAITGPDAVPSDGLTRIRKRI